MNESPSPSSSQAADHSIDQPIIIAGVAIFDTAVVIATALLAAALLPESASATMLSPFALGIVMSGVVMAVQQRVWAYTIASLSNLIRQAARLMAGVLGAFGALVVAIYLGGMEESVPRHFLFTWLALTLAILLVSRILIALSLIHI